MPHFAKPSYSSFSVQFFYVCKHFFRRWADEGISSYSLHPGLVRTEIFSKSDFRSLKEWNDSTEQSFFIILIEEKPAETQTSHQLFGYFA